MKWSLNPGKTAKGLSLAILQPLHLLLDAIPIPGAKDGIGILLGVVEGIDKTSRNSSTLLELENHLRSLTDLLEPVTKMDRNNISSGLKHDVRKLSKDLEHIASSVQSKSSAGGVRRFLERNKDEHDLPTFSQNVKAALDRFQLSQTLRQEQELLLEKRSAAVMSLPRANSAAYDSGREDAPSSCLEGTRVSILTEIMSWFENMESSTPPVYWLVGLAGIGKSTIAKTAAERAGKNKIDAPLRNANLVFPTLAFQLALSDNEFKNAIGEAIQQDPTLGHKNTFSQFEGLILKPLGRLGQADRRHLSCLTHSTSVKNRALTQSYNYYFLTLHNYPSSVPGTSQREFFTILKLLSLRKTFGFTFEGEINSLVEKSGKLFIYAATSIRFIGDPRVRDPRGHLRLILDSQLSKESEVTPYSQLDSLYVGVLRNSLSDSNRKAIVKRFQTVVGSIVLLRQPLPLGSLAEFVQCTPDDIHTALRHLRSVIIPPSAPEESPRIYHPSFRDFIMDPSRCAIPDFVIVAGPDQELRHALRCLELMATFLRQDVAGISDVSLLNSEVKGLGEKVRGALSAEVQYACRYWASHLSCVELGEKRMVEALEGFSMRLILMWIEAMSLIGSLPSAVALVEEAHRWATKSQCEAMVITLLADARRFLLAHRELIRGTYSKDVKSCVRVLQGVEAQWPQSLSTLSGHSRAVYSVAFSPDGLQLASGSEEGMLCLWDAMSGECIATRLGHSGAVASLAFSPDGLQLASGSWDETLCLWDPMLGTCTVTLQGHSDGITSVAFSPDGSRLASGSYDHTVCLWDAILGMHIATLQDHSASVSSVAFSPDGLQLVSGSYDHDLCLWDAMSGTHIKTLHSHSDEVNSVAFSPDGLHIASGSDDHTICLWDAVLGVHIATLQGHSDFVRSLAFSPNGLWLASGSGDSTICLWDAMSGTHIATLHGHSITVTSITFSPDSLWLASGSGDQTLCLWDPMSGTSIITPHGHSDRVSSVAFSPDGLRLASGSYDHTLCLWDVMSGAHIATLQGHSAAVISVAFSPDGVQLASGSNDHTVCLWDVMSATHMATLQGHSGWVISVAYSPNGLRLASGSHDNTVCLWDPMLAAHIATFSHSGWVRSVAFSPNGLQLASSSDDKTIHLLDAMSGAHIATLRGHYTQVTLVAFSPDGLWLVSCSLDQTMF
ncbi:hypothetical protein BS47DRAFT_1389076 [Hydnum rufescens UP504]|uniref:WD40 repeat-like protein n=1 Tax=Hydnum rufescens UP504 TaxID=1448309 RepID=A0A9P6E0Z2_9AGAM|nr:hypothetical protein BS47DRAFT_1389076 [Hydnum rufescens UP504]